MQGQDVLPLIQDNHKDEGHSGGHAVTGAQALLPSQNMTTLVPRGSLLAAIKGRVQGLQGEERRTLHRFSPSTIDTGTCLNHLQRPRIHSLSRLACDPYYKHLGAGYFKSHPPLLEVGPSIA
jgi:hypothetical protein